MQSLNTDSILEPNMSFHKTGEHAYRELILHSINR